MQKSNLIKFLIAVQFALIVFDLVAIGIGFPRPFPSDGEPSHFLLASELFFFLTLVPPIMLFLKYRNNVMINKQENLLPLGLIIAGLISAGLAYVASRVPFQSNVGEDFVTPLILFVLILAEVFLTMAGSFIFELRTVKKLNSNG